MANFKISQLTGATTPVAGTEVLPVVQSGATRKLAISDLTAGLSTIPTTKGGTGLTSFTANGIVYASSTSALATGANLTSDGTNYISTTTSTGGLVTRGARFTRQSTGVGATNICQFTVPYANNAGQGTAAVIDIDVMYFTNDTNTRSAGSVAQLRVLVLRGDRAGNAFDTATSLQLIGSAASVDTGGNPVFLIGVGNFAVTRTGGSSATQTVTISFTPPATLASGGFIVAVAEMVNLTTPSGQQVSLVAL